MYLYVTVNVEVLKCLEPFKAIAKIQTLDEQRFFLNFFPLPNESPHILGNSPVGLNL